MNKKLIAVSVLSLASLFGASAIAQPVNATSNASTSSNSSSQANGGGGGTGIGGAGGSAVGGGASVGTTTSANTQSFTPTLNFNSPDVSTVNQNVSGHTSQAISQTINGTTTTNQNVSGTTTQNQNVNSTGTQTVNQTVNGTTNQNVTNKAEGGTNNTNWNGGYVVQEITGTQTIKNVPSMNAPPLTTSNDTCMGSTSGSGAGAGWGISFGTTWTDSNCTRLKNSREMWNMGLKGASLALLCTDAANREAIRKSYSGPDDYLCPDDREAKKQASAAPAAPVAAGQAVVTPGYTGIVPKGYEYSNLNDPAIARRAQHAAAAAN